MSKRALGIDLSNYVGWGVLESPWKFVECGLITIKPERYESSGMRWIKLERALNELLDTYQPDIVGFEVWGQHKSNEASEILKGGLAILQKVLEQHKVNYLGLKVGDIKKHATANHNASKPLMMKAAALLWPQAELQSDDVADALHIARLTLTKV